jgi:hypothetical protein
MSKRFNNGSHYENHQRADELHEGAAHAHGVAEQHGKQDHLTGHEQSRQHLEHSQEIYEHSQADAREHSLTSFGHDETAALANELWRRRGRPQGSPDEDWFGAVKELRSRASGR